MGRRSPQGTSTPPRYVQTGVNRLILAIMLGAAFAAGCGGDGEQDGGVGGEDQLARASATELLSRDPYMGVSCRIPNSFACDRVGLAVWLREPAARVEAAIAGRELELDDPEWSGPAEHGERRMFAGFLQPAGLIDGPCRSLRTPARPLDRP